MVSHTVFALVALSAAAYAWPTPSQQVPLSWGPCPAEMNYTSEYPYECSTLNVPLDYTQPNGQSRLDLQLLRVRAKNQPAKGAILFNPGGPGGVGTQLVAATAGEFQVVVEGNYDLIGFDPRGTGRTIPFSCGANPDAPASNDTEATGATGPDPRTVTQLSASQLAQEFQPWAVSSVQLAEQCKSADGDIGSLIGTAFVARDMLAIVDALDQGPLLNYMGYSYGTALGATFAAMFPDRVGRMILEANTNVHEYWSGRDTFSHHDTDLVVEAFFEKCVEVGDLCALNIDGATAQSLADNVMALFDALLEQPIPINENLTITEDIVRGWMFQQTYKETKWPNLAKGFGLLFNGSYEEWLVLAFPPNHDTWNQGTMAVAGIRGGDQRYRVNNITEMEDLLEFQVKQSKWFPLSMSRDSISMALWEMDAAERYNGDFVAKTKTPLLLINNLYDNITPQVNAFNTSAGFEGSVVLLQNSYGHIPEYTPSLCTAQAVRNYFNTGALPASGVLCEQDFPAFHPQNVDEYADLQPTQFSKRGFSADDLVLLRAVGSLGKKLHVHVG